MVLKIEGHGFIKISAEDVPNYFIMSNIYVHTCVCTKDIKVGTPKVI